MQDEQVIEYKKNKEKLKWLLNVPEIIRTPLDIRVINNLEKRQNQLSREICLKTKK